MTRRRAWLLNALLVAASLAVGAAMIEGVIAYALAHPEILAGTDRPLFLARNYYARKDRKIVQFLPECAVYDPQVTYTLKPGARCTVANREHTVEYAANRAGLRDDDASLAAPAIVVTGDSHAMGWGVPAEAALPKLLQRDLGVPVLNAAIASYGTARELAMLERLDLAATKAIVIQYCANDLEENQYLATRGRLDILPPEQYQATVAEHARETGYYPFRYVRNLLSLARFAMPWRKSPPVPPGTSVVEARAFLEVLLRHEKLLAGKAVVVFELNEYNRNNDRFVQAVDLLVNEPRFAALKPLVSTIDVAPLLTDADYYLLDDHMRPSGHARVAQAVEAALRKRGVVPAR